MYGLLHCVGEGVGAWIDGFLGALTLTPELQCGPQPLESRIFPRRTDTKRIVTDNKWGVTEPHLPSANCTGRPRAWRCARSATVSSCDAVWLSVASAAERFAAVEHRLSLVCQFRDDGRFEKINHALVMLDRERIGRQTSPTGAIIDSQSVKLTDWRACGHDAGKI